MNKCPNCQSRNIELVNCNDYSDKVEYEYECEECGCEFRETYKMIFEKTEII
jgi:hypothetical protein